MEQIAEAEVRVAELDGTLKAAEPASEEEGEGASGLSEDEVKEIKKKLTAVKKEMRESLRKFEEQLLHAREALNSEGARALALNIFRSDLERILRRYVSAHSVKVVETLEHWWENYKFTLFDLAKNRDRSSTQAEKFLKELGYEK